MIGNPVQILCGIRAGVKCMNDFPEKMQNWSAESD